MSQPRPFSAHPRPEMLPLDDRIVPAATSNHLYAVGTDPGNAALVGVFNPDGTLAFDIQAYTAPNYRGGVRLATADLNGDTIDDIITAPGPGMRSLIQVFDGATGQRMLSFNAFAPDFQGGAYVAAGDVNGDGRADLVVGAGESGGSHVKIFDGKGLFPDPGMVQVPPGPTTNLIREFFAYDAQYRVGARVAVADVDGDGKADVVTGAGNNGGPHVRVFAGADGSVMREFFAYDAKFAGGVYVAAGDLDGDGKAEVATGMGSGGSSRVIVYSGANGQQLRSFIADGAGNSRTAVRVGVVDVNDDGQNELVLGVGNHMDYLDGKSYVRTGGMTPYNPEYIGGVFFG